MIFEYFIYLQLNSIGLLTEYASKSGSKFILKSLSSWKNSIRVTEQGELNHIGHKRCGSLDAELLFPYASTGFFHIVSIKFFSL